MTSRENVWYENNTTSWDTFIESKTKNFLQHQHFVLVTQIWCHEATLCHSTKTLKSSVEAALFPPSYVPECSFLYEIERGFSQSKNATWQNMSGRNFFFSFPNREPSTVVAYSQGGHSIVKLNNHIRTLYIKHHQNGSNFYQFLSWVDIHGTYYIVKNGKWIWLFIFLIKHTVSN